MQTYAAPKQKGRAEERASIKGTHAALTVEFAGAGGRGPIGQLQGIANRGPAALQMKKFQQMADRSPGARGVGEWQGRANRRSGNHDHDRENSRPVQLRIDTARPHPAAPPVQRRVTIRGGEIDSIIDYLGPEQWDELVSLDEAEAAGWMLGLSRTWDFSGPEDLILFVNKVYSLAKLIRSIFAAGLLSRANLVQRGIEYVGSEDVGSGGKLAVNVLDRRGGVRNPLEIARESMTAENRGSISVALEREDDWIKQSSDEDRFGEWIKPQHVQLTEAERKRIEDAQVSGWGGMVERRIRENKAFEQNQLLLNNLYLPEMTERAQNTIMAIIPRPPGTVANLEPRDISYESDFPGGEVRPGAGGFTTLLIPQWFQPFYLMLEDVQPHGVEVRFVGNRAVTAYYKSQLGQIPVTVNAPDYAGEVAQELQTFSYIATHILTA